jgi:hypothetical protein
LEKKAAHLFLRPKTPLRMVGEAAGTDAADAETVQAAARRDGEAPQARRMLRRKCRAEAQNVPAQKTPEKRLSGHSVQRAITPTVFARGAPWRAARFLPPEKKPPATLKENGASKQLAQPRPFPPAPGQKWPGGAFVRLFFSRGVYGAAPDGIQS